MFPVCSFQALIIAAMLGVTAAAHAADTLVAHNFTVIDGQTIEIKGRQVRLTGIEAPRPGQTCILSDTPRDCGVISRSGLLDLTAGATVVCKVVSVSNGDDIAEARCTANGYDLSEGMVYTGWAVPLPDAPAIYRDVLQGARERPRGFWRGEFVDPWPALTAAISTP